MKNFKRIIPYLVAVMVSLAIMLAAGCSCSSCKKEDPRVLQSISINTDAVKKDYVFDQEFTSEGLVVTATYLKKEKSKKTEEVVLEADEYTVNSKAYKKNAVGTYTIIVSYTHKEVTLEQSYDVSVALYQDGLEVTLVEGVLSSNDEEKIDTFTLTSEKKNVEIDTSKITVKEVNKDGTVGKAITDYKVSLYKGQEEVTLTNGKATVGGGAYAIFVEKKSEVFDNYTRVAFAMVYVNDDLVSLELKSGVGTFEQIMGEDIISNTWVFEATYVSGAKADIPSSECVFQVDTMTIGENTVAVSYTGYSATGTAVTKTVDVSYTINRKYGKTIYTYDFNAIDATEITADQTPLTQSHFTGVNSFLKVGTGNLVYRTGSHIIEMTKDASIQVTFGGTGKITIGFASTGGSNWSLVGLKNSSGTYLKATYNTESANIKESSTTNLYEVYGTTESQLTFEVTEAGTYSIFTVQDDSHKRGCRIHSVVLEDNIPEPAAAASLSADNQTYITYKKVERV